MALTRVWNANTRSYEYNKSLSPRSSMLHSAARKAKFGPRTWQYGKILRKTRDAIIHIQRKWRKSRRIVIDLTCYEPVYIDLTLD